MDEAVIRTFLRSDYARVVAAVAAACRDRAPSPSPANPGYLLLLFRDAQGQVFRSFGYVLGPGDTNVG